MKLDFMVSFILSSSQSCCGSYGRKSTGTSVHCLPKPTLTFSALYPRPTFLGINFTIVTIFGHLHTNRCGYGRVLTGAATLAPVSTFYSLLSGLMLFEMYCCIIRIGMFVNSHDSLYYLSVSQRLTTHKRRYHRTLRYSGVLLLFLCGEP